MKLKNLPLLLLLAFSIGFAQKSKKANNKLNTKNIQVVDSIRISKISRRITFHYYRTCYKGLYNFRS